MAKFVNPRFSESLTPKWRRLLPIRSHTVTIARGTRAVDKVEGVSQVTSWSGAGFTITLKAPLQQPASSGAQPSPVRYPNNLVIWLEPDRTKNPAAILPMSRKRELGGTTRPDKLKVLDIAWGSDDGPIRVDAFRRGPWRNYFLALDPDKLKEDQSASK